MQIELKLEDVVVARVALNRLFRESHPKKARDTFKLAKFQRRIDPVLEDYGKAHTELLEKYACADPDTPGRFQFWKKDEDGEPVTDDKTKQPITDPEAIELFEKEHGDLLEEIVRLDIEGGLVLTFFERIGLEPPMSPAEMAALYWLINDFKDGLDESADEDQ